MIFILSTRHIETTPSLKRHTNEPGDAHYLILPDDAQTPDIDSHQYSQAEWITKLTQNATNGHHPSEHPLADFKTGNILFFAHGYNNSQEEVIQRHKLLDMHLKQHGFTGTIVSFDWPCATYTLNYLEDRMDAYQSALKLVTAGITPLAINQLKEHQNQCDIDVHLLGHSTGAYVIREAFYQASKNRSLQRIHWNVSQVCFIGGDIARQSLSHDDNKSKPLFAQASRITNYQSPFDNALKISNIKRAGLAPRCGRVGLPDDAPSNVVNVNCGNHWQALIQPNEDKHIGNWTHSWHFHCTHFAEDLAHTLQGDIDRLAIPTRERVDGELRLTVKKTTIPKKERRRIKEWE
ncbi:alpha/beta hydrolase [Aliivibrio finisterrensis]|uniref:alpha/beta hydrolase n=1 Tax=Aliivibrio finisterrensis TaxID=511998 RepID=UPI001020ECDA|nr:alpha/beta hydrolase [Aliivibrio finisterrensis]RYU70357.1 alpha/beta hydrolase [Aliivibrio finisterrensis]RYU74219.1 alpha/beta hydrolase [Aliivibrio finisterrensis]RYU76824.1 alpha/beta hydrolase [Aliivibrio finisterrensis]